MVDLDEKSLATIKKILSKHLTNVPVKAFGSRVTGQAKQFSDLDLVIKDENAIAINTLNQLKFDFSNSDLSIMVDIVDWHSLSNAFRTAIEAHCETFTYTN